MLETQLKVTAHDTKQAGFSWWQLTLCVLGYNAHKLLKEEITSFFLDILLYTLAHSFLAAVPRSIHTARSIGEITHVASGGTYHTQFGSSVVIQAIASAGILGEINDAVRSN